MNTPAIQVSKVSKSFGSGPTVLKHVDVCLQRGEMVALIGASGSGKSTLIRAIAGLMPIDRPGKQASASYISVLGTPIQSDGRILKDAQAVRSQVSVIFQQFNLVPRLSVLTNVCLGLLGQIPALRGTLGQFTRTERQRAMVALARVGIAGQALQRGSQLSGGQQQRAAIARALLQDAKVILADEPIASLDPSSARRVMDALAELNRRDGLTILVSLHQVEYALEYCARTIALKAGEVVYDGPTRALSPKVLANLYGAESAELFLPGFEEKPSVRPASDLISAAA